MLGLAALLGGGYIFTVKSELPLLGGLLAILGWPAIFAVPLVVIELAALLTYAVWTRRVVATADALSRVG
jgi:hypothetical protein